MKTQIYYFSGTGNSLFAARELQKRLESASLIPIASLINRPSIKTATAVGIVFPVHALTIPVVIKRFIKKTDFGSADYIFAVATRYGSVFRGFEKISSLLHKKRKRLGSGLILNMGNNEGRHKGYIVPTKEDIKNMEDDVLKQLDAFAKIVNEKNVSLPADTGVTVPTGSNRLTSFLIEKTVLTGMDLSDHIGGVQYFYVDKSCNGCGTCEKICLSGKITMNNSQPIWQKNVFCTMCFACLNYCPKRAVQISDIPGVRSYTKENGRYSHPYATVADIAGQKGV